MRLFSVQCRTCVVLSLTVLTDGFAPSHVAIHSQQQGLQSTPARTRRHGHTKSLWRLGSGQLPQNDEDASTPLVRFTTLIVHTLTRPTPVAALPGGVVLALVLLPVVTPLSQTVLTLILFLVLALLGRLATGPEVEVIPQELQMIDDDDDDDDDGTTSSSWTDTFALVFAASTAYLVIPPSLMESLEVRGLTGPAVGMSILAATVAILSWQTGANASTESFASEENGLEGNVSGDNGELLNKWDEEMKWRELHKEQNTQGKEQDD